MRHVLNIQLSAYFSLSRNASPCVFLHDSASISGSLDEIDGDLTSTESTMTCPRRKQLMMSLDGINLRVFCSPRRFHDLSSKMVSPRRNEDEKPPSLSRRLTSMKNHFTSFSGPALSSMKSKRKVKLCIFPFISESFFVILISLLCWFLPHDLSLSLFLQMDGSRDEGSSNKTTTMY